MELESLAIYTYSGAPKGTIKFKNELGVIELRLDDEACREMFQVCGKALVRISKKAADEMSAKVLDALNVATIEVQQ